MKKALTRILALALAVMLTLTLAPAAFAAETEAPATSGSCGENLTWNFDVETGALTIEGTGPMTDYDAGTVKPWAALQREGYEITSITIGEGVTTVGNSALSSTGVQELQLPSTLKSIGQRAFLMSYALKEVVIPDSVETIGSTAFSMCTALEYVSVGNRVTTIGDSAFAYARALRSVVLPASLTAIEAGAFAQCTILSSVYYGGTEAAWNRIQIGENNDALRNASIYYNTNGYVFPFRDVAETHWAYDAIALLNAAGIINGYEDGTFRPQNSVTRAEFVTMLAKISGIGDSYIIPDIVSYGYSDVPRNSGAWYAHYVHWAQVNNIVAGYPDGTFRPNEKITREQMAAMIYRFAEYEQIVLPAVNAPVVFRDAAAIAAYAREPVGVMQTAGIINGYPEKDGSFTFRPKNNATRAEAATMLSGIYAYTLAQ